MKRLFFILFSLVVLSFSAANAANIGVGAQVGMDFPLVQDDQAEGMIFGLKATYNLMGMLSIEPNMTFTKYGDPELSDYPSIFEGLEGSKVNYFGVNGLLGSGFGMPGIHPYFMAGAGIYTQKNDQTDQDISELGVNFGLGLEISLAQNIGFDGRGRINVIPLSEGGSKKSLAATVGVNFYFGN